MRRTFAVTLALLLFACGGNVITVSGIDVYEDIWRETIADVGRVASFQMNCPAEQLEFTLLRRQNTPRPEQVGVAGCGQRDVYTQIGGSWFASGQQGEAAAMQMQVEEEQRRAAAAAQQQQQYQQQQSR